MAGTVVGERVAELKEGQSLEVARPGLLDDV
jgi:hypothetical protein